MRNQITPLASSSPTQQPSLQDEPSIVQEKSKNRMIKSKSSIIALAILLTYPIWVIIISLLDPILQHPHIGERICVDIDGEGICTLEYFLYAFLISVLFVSLAILILRKADQNFRKTIKKIMILSISLLILLLFPYMRSLITYQKFVSKCNKYSFPNKLKEATINNDKGGFMSQITFKIDFDSIEAVRVPYIYEEDAKGCVVTSKIELSAYDATDNLVFRHKYKIGYRSTNEETETKTLFDKIINNYDLIALRNVLLIYPTYHNVARTETGMRADEAWTYIEESSLSAISLDGGETWEKIDLLNSERFLSYDFYKGRMLSTIKNIEVLSREKIEISNWHTNFVKQKFVFAKVGDVFKYSSKGDSE